MGFDEEMEIVVSKWAIAKWIEGLFAWFLRGIFLDCFCLRIRIVEVEVFEKRVEGFNIKNYVVKA